jgi:hypothetical protein
MAVTTGRSVDPALLFDLKHLRSTNPSVGIPHPRALSKLTSRPGGAVTGGCCGGSHPLNGSSLNEQGVQSWRFPRRWHV